MFSPGVLLLSEFFLVLAAPASATTHLLAISTFCNGEGFSSTDVLPQMQAAVAGIDGFSLDVRDANASVVSVNSQLAQCMHAVDTV